MGDMSGKDWKGPAFLRFVIPINCSVSQSPLAFTERG
jgi:hypothetical protein